MLESDCDEAIESAGSRSRTSQFGLLPGDGAALTGFGGVAVVVLRNELPYSLRIQAQIGERALAVELPPDPVGRCAEIRPGIQ